MAEPLLAPSIAEFEATRRVLNYVRREYEERMSDPSRPLDWNFFIGIFSVVFIGWAMGAIPQHIWLIYMIIATCLFVFRFKRIAVPKAMRITKTAPTQLMIRLFYVFEFCYIANFSGLLLVFLLACDPHMLSDRMATFLFRAGFGISCGTLLSATVIFGNKLMFHDVDHTVSILLHLFPSLVMYTFRWEYEAIKSSWPYLFHRLGPNAFSDHSLANIYTDSILFYFAWLVPYSLWLIFHGRNLPKNTEFDLPWCRLNGKCDTAYDTCFHFNMRDNAFGKIVVVKILGNSHEELERKRREHDYSVLEVFTYNALHAAVVTASVAFSFPSFLWKPVHGAAIAGVSTYALYKGSLIYAKTIAVCEDMDMLVRAGA